MTDTSCPLPLLTFDDNDDVIVITCGESLCVTHETCAYIEDQTVNETVWRVGCINGHVFLLSIEDPAPDYSTEHLVAALADHARSTR